MGLKRIEHAWKLFRCVSESHDHVGLTDRGFQVESCVDVQDDTRLCIDEWGCVALFAALESTLRHDIRYREEERLDDPQSSKLVEALKERTRHQERRPSFEAILNVYFTVFEPDVAAIRDLERVWRYRDWIAHGKCWNHPDRSLSVEDAFFAVACAQDMFWDVPKDPIERS